MQSSSLVVCSHDINIFFDYVVLRMQSAVELGCFLDRSWKKKTREMTGFSMCVLSGNPDLVNIGYCGLKLEQH